MEIGVTQKAGSRNFNPLNVNNVCDRLMFDSLVNNFSNETASGEPHRAGDAGMSGNHHRGNDYRSENIYGSGSAEEERSNRRERTEDRGSMTERDHIESERVAGEEGSHASQADEGKHVDNQRNNAVRENEGNNGADEHETGSADSANTNSVQSGEGAKDDDKLALAMLNINSGRGEGSTAALEAEGTASHGSGKETEAIKAAMNTAGNGGGQAASEGEQTGVHGGQNLKADSSGKGSATAADILNAEGEAADAAAEAGLMKEKNNGVSDESKPDTVMKKETGDTLFDQHDAHAGLKTRESDTPEKDMPGGEHSQRDDHDRIIEFMKKYQHSDEGMEPDFEAGNAVHSRDVNSRVIADFAERVLREGSADKSSGNGNSRTAHNSTGMINGSGVSHNAGRLNGMFQTGSVTKPSGFSEVVDKIVYTTKGDNRLGVTVEHGSLGKLNIHLSLDRGMVNVHINTHDGAVREFVENNIQQIIDSLEKSGVSVGGFSVALKNSRNNGGYEFTPHAGDDAFDQEREIEGVYPSEAYSARPSARGIVNIFA